MFTPFSQISVELYHHSSILTDLCKKMNYDRGGCLLYQLKPSRGHSYSMKLIVFKIFPLSFSDSLTQLFGLMRIHDASKSRKTKSCNFLLEVRWHGALLCFSTAYKRLTMGENTVSTSNNNSTLIISVCRELRQLDAGSFSAAVGCSSVTHQGLVIVTLSVQVSVLCVYIKHNG